MAKELPYFKFEPSEWENGSIQMVDRALKGLFVDICCMYWSRLGNLPYALALQKLCNGNASLLQELCKHEIIEVNEDKISIKFLDEQLSEFSGISKERAKAANKRWKNANALQKQSKSNAIREDKRREDNILNTSFGENHKIYFLILSDSINEPACRINYIQGLVEYVNTHKSLLPNANETLIDEFMKKFNGKAFNGYNHLYNSWLKFIDNGARN